MSSLFLFNTQTRKKEIFTPQKKGEVSFYSCGPTVYNRVHIGNLRAFLFADTLQRYLRFGKGYDVKWVMNITDVDDKTIRDSQLKFPDQDPQEALKNFTQLYFHTFFEDLERLNIQKDSFFANPKATGYIPEMQKLVYKIVENGYGYVSDGSIYFDLKRYSKDYKYGKLSHVDFGEMKSTSRVDNDEYEKSSASDFVLWKAKKGSEPSWDFDVDGENCEGRPGWHLECTAMSYETLNIPFDIHSGGVDLCFPHHEDEIAQSVAAYGKEPAHFWVHNEHLMVEGKKMSKSLGNFYLLDDLLKKGFSADEIRFFLVSSHYRTKVNLSDDSLSAAAQMLKRIRNFLGLGVQKKSVLSSQYIEDFSVRFFSALDDDLNVSVALSEFFECARFFASNKAVSTQNVENVESVEFTNTIGVFSRIESLFGISFLPQKDEIPAEVLTLYEKRLTARKNKNWALSDALRDDMLRLGYEVRDGKNGGIKRIL